MVWLVDALVVVIIVAYGALGVRSGAARQTAVTVGVLLAAVIGFEWFPRLAHYSLVLAGSLVINERWTQFLASLLGFLIVTAIVAAGVDTWIGRPARLAPMQRLLGLVLGLVNGFLIAAFLARYLHEYLFAADPHDVLMQSIAGALLIQWLGVALLVLVVLLIPVFIYQLAGRIVSMGKARRQHQPPPGAGTSPGWEEPAGAGATSAPASETNT